MILESEFIVREFPIPFSPPHTHLFCCYTRRRREDFSASDFFKYSESNAVAGSMGEHSSDAIIGSKENLFKVKLNGDFFVNKLMQKTCKL